MATAAATSPITAIQALGQSVWIDFMSRPFLRDGELRRLIAEDDLRGATSNPTIFGKAIGQGTAYDDQFAALDKEGASAEAIYDALTTQDIRAALDEFRPTYDRTGGLDGYVSLEVSPALAHDTAATIAEARRLWGLLDRPNAMIKIPGTPEGLPAIEECLYRGLNINVTLLFSTQAYENVARTFVAALQRRRAEGKPVDRVASVASFFVSRIDTEVDKRLDAVLPTLADPARRSKAESLKGKIAIANAKAAYEVFRRVFGEPAWAPLAEAGARVQRVLWASTGTKNPAYPDTLYVDELIGPDTVNTMPPETYAAVRDHGRAAPTLERSMAEARQQIAALAEFGISLDDVTATLLRDGVDRFAKDFDTLMDGIRRKKG